MGFRCGYMGRSQLEPADIDPAIELLVDLLRRVPASRLALTKSQAAYALAMSVDSFERHVLPDVRCVRKGRLRLYPIRELEAWLERNAEPIFR